MVTRVDRVTPYPSSMASRRSARHSRPSGRRALEQAHALLQGDVSTLRSQRFADHLELVRLTTLVEGLVAHLQQLSRELAEMRRELQAARTAPQQPDPVVAQLASEVADLRATVATQQSMLSELSGRLLDVMGRLGPDPWAAHPDAAHAAPAPAPVVEPAEPAEPAETAERVGAAASVEPVEAPLPAPAEVAPAAPAPQLTDLRDPALPVVPDYPPHDEPTDVRSPIPASVSAAAAEMSRREPILAEVVAATPGYRPPAVPGGRDAEALDDETVLRLRMIRESFGG